MLSFKLKKTACVLQAVFLSADKSGIVDNL